MDNIILWLKVSPSLSKGITVVNKLEETKFEQFLQRILAKIKMQDKEIFSNEEIVKLLIIFQIDENSLSLAIKTIVYLFRRMLKFIFMPVNLKNDLETIGLENDKIEIFVKLWSQETKNTLNELETDMIDDQRDSLDISWKVNAELSSEYHKKCKIPITYLSLHSKKNETNIEMIHQDLYSIFIQFESVQNELDTIF